MNPEHMQTMVAKMREFKQIYTPIRALNLEAVNMRDVSNLLTSLGRARELLTDLISMHNIGGLAVDRSVKFTVENARTLGVVAHSDIACKLLEQHPAISVFEYLAARLKSVESMRIRLQHMQSDFEHFVSQAEPESVACASLPVSLSSISAEDESIQEPVVDQPAESDREYYTAFCTLSVFGFLAIVFAHLQ
jgi:hypothetical protein